MSLHKTHICVVKSLVKIAAVSWHSLRRFIKPAPGRSRVRFARTLILPFVECFADDDVHTLHVGLAFCSSAIARVLAEYVWYVLSSGIWYNLFPKWPAIKTAKHWVSRDFSGNSLVAHLHAVSLEAFFPLALADPIFAKYANITYYNINIRWQIGTNNRIYNS